MDSTNDPPFGRPDVTTIDGADGAVDHVAHRMKTSRELLDWLGGEFARRAGPPTEAEEGVAGRAGPAVEGAVAGSTAGLEVQVARVCELVNLALGQVDLHRDLGMAWILLEQARQQVGHAAASAGKVDRERDDAEGEGDVRAAARAQLEWLLQRDLMPWPRNAAEVVDFGGGPGLLPDFLPDTPLELLPLQVLANWTMTLAAGVEAQDPGDEVMAMAFGEYVSMIMIEAMELLERSGVRNGGAGPAAVVDTGFQVAHLIAGAFPPAWQVFRGPADFPGDVA